MFAVILELAISLVVCGALVYFLFLSGTMDEELRGDVAYTESTRPDLASRAYETSGRALLGDAPGECGGFTHKVLGWARRVYSLASHSAGWSPRRVCGAAGQTYRSSRTGRRAHDQPFSYPTTRAQRSPSVLYTRGATNSLRGEEGRVTHDHAGFFVRPDGQAAHAPHTAHAPPCHADACRERVQWFTCAAYWVALCVLGGGNPSPAVWQARCRVMLTRVLRDMSTRWTPTARVRDGGGLRGTLGTALEDTVRTEGTRVNCPTASPQHARESALRLLHLQLGPGATMPGTRCPTGVLIAPAPRLNLPSSTPRRPAPSCDGDTAALPYVAHAESVAPPELDNAAAATTTHLTVHGSSGTSGCGVVLPQLVDEVTSVEMRNGDVYADAVRGCGAEAAVTAVGAHVTTGRTAWLPVLRCFNLPLCYEDGHFVVGLGGALPLAWLLPSQLCIPSDTLALHCSVTVRRVRFHGALHLAFCGAVLELCFPTAPQFEAEVELGGPAPPSSALGAGCFARPSAKVQELVTLAIQRAVCSLVYPRVVRARLQWGVCPSDTVDDAAASSMPCHVPRVMGAQAGWQGWLCWQRARATLPLYRVPTV